MADITIRLYRQHDMDLINLYRTPGYKFQRIMKEVLLANVSGTSYVVPMPGENEKPEAGYVPKSMTMHFVLNTKKEAEKKAYELLKNIKKGYRNSFFKALFRSYMPSIPLSSYFDGDGLKMHYTNIEDLGTITITEDEEKENPTEDVVTQSNSLPSNANDTSSFNSSKQETSDIYKGTPFAREEQTTPESIPQYIPKPPVPEPEQQFAEDAKEQDSLSDDDMMDMFSAMSALSH